MGWLAQTPFRSIHNFNVEKRILIKLNQNAYRFLITPSFTAKINEGPGAFANAKRKLTIRVYRVVHRIFSHLIGFSLPWNVELESAQVDRRCSSLAQA
jgi:hypothetical protein